MGIEKKTNGGVCFNAIVLEVTKDKVKLYNEDTGEKIWVEKNKLRVMPRKIMAYIQLPGDSSRHMGYDYGKGTCVER